MSLLTISASILTGLAVVLALPPPRKAPSRLAVTPGFGEGTRSADPWAGGEPGSAHGISRFRVVLAAAAAGAGTTLMLGGLTGAAFGLVAAVLVWRTVSRLEPPASRRRREGLARGLPHAVDLMASSLMVGASPSSAVELVANAVDPPLCVELQMVTRRLAMGVDPVRVWSDVGRHPQLGALGRCLARAIDSGASVADAMHRLAEDLRRSSRADLEARARTVGVKAAAPLGLCLLPAFILTGVVPLVAGSVSTLLGP